MRGSVPFQWRHFHADTHHMKPGVRAGAPVQVIQRGANPPLQMHGVAVTGMGPVVAVRFETPWPGAPGDDVLLVAGDIGARMVARGRLHTMRASIASFEITDAWKPINLRANARFSTCLGAEVRSVLGQSRQNGTIIDISLGGMSVVTATKPGGREVAIVTTAGAYSATLPCEIVHTSRGQDCVTLHLKFRELTAAQSAFVRNLVAAASARPGVLEAGREAS